jgi:hypothetical protein
MAHRQEKLTKQCKDVKNIQIFAVTLFKYLININFPP